MPQFTPHMQGDASDMPHLLPQLETAPLLTFSVILQF
jgi:hypothetical protein